MILLAALFSIASLASCTFASFDTSAGNFINAADEDAINFFNSSGLLDPNLAVTANIGLLNWEPGDLGCRSYDNPKSMDSFFRGARICGMLAAIFACVAFILFFVECVFWRFLCGRALITFLALFGFLLQGKFPNFQCMKASASLTRTGPLTLFSSLTKPHAGMTFLVYASEYCLQTRGDYAYSCGFETGSFLSTVAVALLLISTFLVCCTPKGKPLLKILMDKPKTKNDTDKDSCFYCCTKKDKLDDEAGEDEEQAEGVVGAGDDTDEDAVTEESQYQQDVAILEELQLLSDKRRALEETGEYSSEQLATLAVFCGAVETNIFDKMEKRIPVEEEIVPVVVEPFTESKKPKGSRIKHWLGRDKSVKDSAVEPGADAGIDAEAPDPGQAMETAEAGVDELPFVTA